MRPFAARFFWTEESGSDLATANSDPLRVSSFDVRFRNVYRGGIVCLGDSSEFDDPPQRAVHWDKVQDRLVFGDVRLYEELSLRREMFVDGDLSPIQLVTRVLDERGDRGLSRVAGDFAAVFWDARRGAVDAVRDHFGARPLYYRILSDGVAFASNVRDLLLRGDAAGDELDEDMVLDYLLGDFAHHGRSFFKEIRQVWPGHRIRLTSSHFTQTRFWSPPQDTEQGLTYPDMIAEWRRLFDQSVRRRLKSSHPVASYLSGGMDSGAIVGAAHRAYVDGHGGPPFFTLSALFPAISSFDETELIRAALVGKPQFSAFTWDGTEKNDEDFTSPSLSMPGLRSGIGRSRRRELAFIRDRGIRSVFSGFGGDELGWAHGYFRDLVSRGKGISLVREMSQMKSWVRAAHHVRMGLRGVGAPRVSSDPPRWLSPLLRRTFWRRTDDRRSGKFQFQSCSQQETWWIVTLPQGAYITDVSRLVLAEAGAELLLPYCDLALVEFVLRIPWQLRAPQGDLRRVQRDAIGPFLCPQVRDGRSKVLGGGVFSAQIRSNVSVLASYLEGKTWVSEDFVNQSDAREQFHMLLARDPRISRPGEWESVWKIVVFEAWNRARMNYHLSRRHMMQDAKETEAVAGSGFPVSVAGSPYEAPSVTPVGNARAMLALTTGPSFDAEPGSDGQNSS